jgi:hypothetical protein
VRLLSNEGLMRFITKVKVVSKQAMEDVDAGKLNIKVDDFSRKEFEQLQKFVEGEIKAVKKGAELESSRKRQKTD